MAKSIIMNELLSGNEKTMIIMIGIQGSGKSTFCKKCFNETNWVRVNLDTLHTRKNERKLLYDSIYSNKNIVIDNTNPTAEDRRKYIESAISSDYKVYGFFMQSVIKDCIIRNGQREGKACVPNFVIATTSNKLELPKYEEGFDKLIFVKIDNDDFIIDEWRE